MDKDFIMATAKTIQEQILWSINKWEYMSWGIRQRVAIEYEGMATLALRVSGAVHKGWVYIGLNEGMDCYEVRLLNVARTKVKRTLEEVYCDNLGQVLDGLIERKAEWTDEQYKHKAASDSARKMGMEVLDTSKNKSNENQKTMANEIKYRPATMAEIENRSVDLYMNGERVDILMVSRSETIGENDCKLDSITLTNLKKVQPEDLQVIDNGEGEPEPNDNENINENINENKEEETMATNNVKAADLIGKEIYVKGTKTKYVIKSMDGDNIIADFYVGSALYPNQPMQHEFLQKIFDNGQATLTPPSDGATAAPKAEPKPAPKAKQEKKGNPSPALPKGREKSSVSGKYFVLLLPTKDGGQWPKLYGFKNGTEAKALLKKLPDTIAATWDYGPNNEGAATMERYWCLRMGLYNFCQISK